MDEQTLSNLRLIRQSFGYKQMHAADKLGISQPAYSKWENGITELDDDKKLALSFIYNKTWEEIENHHEHLKKEKSPDTTIQKRMAEIETELLKLKNMVAQFIKRGGVITSQK